MKDVLSHKEVVVRKEQVCFGCRRKMPKGTLLEKITEVDEGMFTTTYWCDVCRIYWKEHMEWDGEVGFGELRENDPEEWERIYLKRKEIQGK